MPDISMCKNNTCPSRKSCYRYTAKPNEFRQSYGSFEVKKTPTAWVQNGGGIEL